MDIMSNFAFQAAALQQQVDIALYGQLKDQAVVQSSQLLQDFAQAQPVQAPHPYAGQSIDIRI